MFNDVVSKNESHEGGIKNRNKIMGRPGRKKAPIPKATELFLILFN
jgi:hypothetical protein